MVFPFFFLLKFFSFGFHKNADFPPFFGFSSL
jgi:hypothetical protein